MLQKNPNRPDTPNSNFSATKKTPYAESKIIVIKRVLSFTTIKVTKYDAKPNNNPKIGPPNANQKNIPIPSAGLISAPFDDSRKIVKNTMATPSFNNDSISINVLVLKGAPNSFNKATTATGSVVPKIQPKVNASAQVKELSS